MKNSNDNGTKSGFHGIQSVKDLKAEMRYLLSSILTRQIVKGRIVVQILFLYSTILINYSFVRRFDENCNKIESELA